MKAYIYNLESKENYIENSVMALGSFYSMHIGHQKLFDETLSQAKEQNKKSGVLIFNEKDKFPQQEIYTLNWRVNYLLEYGFDFVVIFDKTQINMNSEGDEFISNLISNYGATNFIVGKDFKFGRMAKWDATYLMNNYGATVIDLVKLDGKKVATSFIREVIEQGDLKLLENLLGRKYSSSGIVVKGEGQAGILEIPTANLDVDNKLTSIPEGVYLAYSKIDSLMYPSLVSVGRKPTFHDQWDVTFESHILNFDKKIYGETLEIIYLKKMRNQIKFDSIDKLIIQLRTDKDEAISWFINNKL